MEIDPALASPVDVYQALVGAVVPRPIAWATTVDEAGRPNLAPFSFFNVFGANPPVVVFSPTLRRDGSKKDTLLNLERVPEFVIHVATEPLAERMNLTAKEVPPGESEIALAGLTAVPSSVVRPPRVAESPVAMEGRVRQIIPVGDGPISGSLVIGEIVRIHVSDAILGDDGRIDPRKLQAVGRLGGDWYCRSTDLFALKRP